MEAQSPLRGPQPPAQGPGRRPTLPPPASLGTRLRVSPQWPLRPLFTCTPALRGPGEPAGLVGVLPAGGPSPREASWLPRLSPGLSPPGSPARRTLSPAQPLEARAPPAVTASRPRTPASPKAPGVAIAAGFRLGEEGQQKVTSGHPAPAPTPGLQSPRRTHASRPATANAFQGQSLWSSA